MIDYPSRTSHGLVGLDWLEWNQTNLKALRSDFAPVIRQDSGAAGSKGENDLIRFSLMVSFFNINNDATRQAPFQIYQQRPGFSSGPYKASKTIGGLGISITTQSKQARTAAVYLFSSGKHYFSRRNLNTKILNL